MPEKYGSSKEDYSIRPQTPEEIERNSSDDIPEYRINIDLTQQQIERLTEQFFIEFEALKRERESLNLPSIWKAADEQYLGDLQSNKRLIFNLRTFQSKTKVDAITRAIAESFLGNGQIADISPRPEMANTKDGYAVCDKQTQFLDYVMDEEIKPETDIRKIAKCAAKKFVGIGKIEWKYQKEKRRREESYEGKNIIVGFVDGKPVINNEGLQQFLNAYPDAMEKQKGYIKRLIQEQRVNIVVEYNDTINNNAKIKYVPVEDFYVRNDCNYWEGLRTEHCVVEKVKFTYWELLKKKKDKEFVNVDQLFDAGSDDSTENKEYITKSYDILEATTYFKLDESDDEECKFKAYFSEDKKVFLGATLYPWYAIDVEYVPFYLELNDEGFYGGGKSIMFTLRDSEIAQSALLNLALHGTYARNILTPIVAEGSELEQLFIERDFKEGMPLPYDDTNGKWSDQVGFVEWPNIDLNSIFSAIQFQQRMDSNATGINDAASTGQNDPTDPTAPASKTIALLQQSGINIKDYISCFLPSFNIMITNVFQLYYQMSQEGRKYKIRRKSEGVTGADVFANISRDDLIAKTNVQARAASFAFDKINEKREAIAGLQLVQSNSYLAQIPKAQYDALLIALSTLGPRWKNLADSLPSPEEFNKQQLNIAIQAVSAIVQKIKQQQEVTGVAPQVNQEQLADEVTKAQATAYNPALAPIER